MRFVFFFLTICMSAAVVGCSQQATPALTGVSVDEAARLGASAVAAPAVKFKPLYSFQGAPDGALPDAALAGTIRLNELLLVGTTSQGGTQNLGSVFHIKINGDERVDHSFTSTPDGKTPKAGLTEGLVGTTQFGGVEGQGTVYEIALPAGTERVIYSFNALPDAAVPNGNLIEFDRNLYGTAAFGGSGSCNSGCGAIFAIDKHTGAEHVVYSFSDKPDGSRPHGGLAELKGALYGTTFSGGANGSGCVFKVLPNGTERVIYSFKGRNGNDGANPLAGLTVMNDLLYGVTSKGGGKNEGTVFVVDEAGTERVLHSFNATTDGSDPRANLTALEGNLYGSAISGGKFKHGTLFEVHANGAFRVLHEFEGASDGAGPVAGLTAVFSNALFGTTRYGGSHNKGTVFLLQL